MKCKKCKEEEKNIWAGQGFTQYKCEHCGQLGWYCNTCAPKICYTCSDENFLCEQCGKNIMVEAVLTLKEKSSFYEVALDIGISETSLKKYVNGERIGEKTSNKIKKFVKEELRKDEQRLDR